MSEFYGPPDEAASLQALEQAFELGYRHFDTADMYGQGRNELLLSRFLKGKTAAQRDEIVVATKAGIVRSRDDKFTISVNGKPDYIRAACHASLERLGVDHIDLFYLHRLDHATPLEQTLDAFITLRKEGKIGGIGLCEVTADTLVQAVQTTPIAAMQSEYSLWSRDLETGLLSTCQALGIAVVAFSPLGRGFLSAKIDEHSMRGMDQELDFRTRLPRFNPQNMPNNLALVAELRSLANKLAMTPAQLSLAWLLSKNPALHAIPGSKTARYLVENFAAARIVLDVATVLALDDIFTPSSIAGARYPESKPLKADV